MVLRSLIYWPKLEVGNMKYLYLSLFYLLILSSCKNEAPLKYEILIPEDKQSVNLPVIFFLHGWGGTLNQFIPFVKDEFGDAILVFPQAPFREGEKGNSWAEMSLGKNEYKENLKQAEYSRLKLLEFVEYIIEKYDADRSKIFIFGASQGAMMTLRLGLNPPYPAKGLICINGRIPMKLFQDSLKVNVLDKIELYIVNGIEDTIIPIQSGRALVNELTHRGLRLESHESKSGHALDKKVVVEIAKWVNARSFDKSVEGVE